MAVDIVQAVHSSPVAQNIEAVENAQRNPNPQRGAGGTLPGDKFSGDKFSGDRLSGDSVTISPEARNRQVADAGEKAAAGKK